MAKEHDFNECLDAGRVVELAVRDFMLQHGIDVREAADDEQRRGIDFVNTTTDHSYQVKADWKASQTGNVFAETWSVVQDGDFKKPGWAQNCDATWLLYVLPGEGKMYGMNTRKVRAVVMVWDVFDRYKKARSKNKGYESEGLLVPVDVWARLAAKEYQIGKIEVPDRA